MLNVISDSLQKEYDRYIKSSGITKGLSILAKNEGLEAVKFAKAEIDSNKMGSLGKIALTIKRIEEIKEAITIECLENMTVNDEKV